MENLLLLIVVRQIEPDPSDIAVPVVAAILLIFLAYMCRKEVTHRDSDKSK